MRSHYERLRASIVNLAASPEAQVAYLDAFFASMTGGGSAEGYGNGELIHQFDDVWSVIGSVVEWGEISPFEVDAISPLSDLLDQLCANAEPGFWLRPALYSDVRWEAFRHCARQVLEALPDRS